MKLWVLVVAALLALSPLSWAGEDIDRQLKEARWKVDEAARQLAELYREHYAQGVGKKKAMLGILLGDEPNRNGVELVGVTPGGGAEAVGIQAGDLIVKLNDLDLSKAPSPMRALSKYMKSVEPGDEVTLAYLRDGKRHEVTLTTQAHSQQMLRMITKKMDKLDLDLDLDLDDMLDLPEVRHAFAGRGVSSPRSFLYVEGDLAEYFDVDAGVVLVTPPEGSKLKAGDVLLRVGDHEVDDVAGATKLLSQLTSDSHVSIMRQGKHRRVTVAQPEFATIEPAIAPQVIRVEVPKDQHSSGVVILKIETPEAPEAPPRP